MSKPQELKDGKVDAEEWVGLEGDFLTCPDFKFLVSVVYPSPTCCILSSVSGKYGFRKRLMFTTSSTFEQCQQ